MATIATNHIKPQYSKVNEMKSKDESLYKICHIVSDSSSVSPGDMYECYLNRRLRQRFFPNDNHTGNWHIGNRDSMVGLGVSMTAGCNEKEMKNLLFPCFFIW